MKEDEMRGEEGDENREGEAGTGEEARRKGRRRGERRGGDTGEGRANGEKSRREKSSKEVR